MSIGEITSLLRDGILHVLIVVGPMLIPALVVGLLVAILQASTSIQEQTLTFVPKIVVILVMLAILGGWMFTTLGQYTINLFSQIQNMAR
jgi:flagellar biosynthetic protein FliQ